MTEDQKGLLRSTLQMVVDMAIGRTMWAIHPGVAAAFGAVAFAVLWAVLGHGN